MYNPRGFLIPPIHPLNDDTGIVSLLDWMGGDQAVTDRARKCYQSQDKASPEADARLLKRLVGSKPLHGTTLRGTVMTFDVVAPLFVVRQWTRHIVGHEYDGADIWHVGGDQLDTAGAFDEQSLRYVDPDAAFYIPDRIGEAKHAFALDIAAVYRFYRKWRDDGVVKELARCFLPVNLYVQMEWTVNAQALLDWASKRIPGGGAQWETSQYTLAVLQLAHKHVIPGIITQWATEAGCLALIEEEGDSDE